MIQIVMRAQFKKLTEIFDMVLRDFNTLAKKYTVCTIVRPGGKIVQ